MAVHPGRPERSISVGFVRSAVLLPPAGAALALAYAALHMRTPAPDVARLCVTIAAGLLLVTLTAWVARDGHRFGREERLSAFLVFAAVTVGYSTSRQAIAEDEFDAIVLSQQHELEQTTAQLSREIIAFVDGRSRMAPPPPRPETWEQDEAIWLAFEQQTVAAYVPRFSSRVRRARAGLTFRNIRDRDLDAFYQAPASSFQIRVVGERLGVLADRVRRAIEPAG